MVGIEQQISAWIASFLGEASTPVARADAARSAGARALGTGGADARDVTLDPARRDAAVLALGGWLRVPMEPSHFAACDSVESTARVAAELYRQWSSVLAADASTDAGDGSGGAAAPSGVAGRFAYLMHRQDAVLANPPAEARPSRRAVNLDGDGRGGPAVAVADLAVETASGHAACGDVILVGEMPATTAGPGTTRRGDDDALRAGLALARERGATRIGLSPAAARLSADGLDLLAEGCPLNAGHTLMAAATGQVLDATLSRVSRRWSATTAAVLGATSPLGRATVMLLAERAARLVIVGDPPAGTVLGRQALLAVAAEACSHLAAGHGTGPLAAHVRALLGRTAKLSPLALSPVAERLVQTGFVVLSTDRRRLLAADVVAVAGHGGAPLATELLRSAAIVCDMAEPRAVSPQAAAERPDVLVIDPGCYELADGRAPGGLLGARGLPAPLVETLVLTLAGDRDHAAVGGRVDMEHLQSLTQLAGRFGFRLAPISSFGTRVEEARLELMSKLRALPAPRLPGGGAALHGPAA